MDRKIHLGLTKGTKLINMVKNGKKGSKMIKKDATLGLSPSLSNKPYLST